MAYLMYALRYFDVSVFLEAVWSHLGELNYEVRHFYLNYFFVSTISRLFRKAE